MNGIVQTLAGIAVVFLVSMLLWCSMRPVRLTRRFWVWYLVAVCLYLFAAIVRVTCESNFEITEESVRLLAVAVIFGPVVYLLSSSLVFGAKNNPKSDSGT